MVIIVLVVVIVIPIVVYYLRFITDFWDFPCRSYLYALLLAGIIFCSSYQFLNVGFNIFKF